jgi:hypothetical protein
MISGQTLRVCPEGNRYPAPDQVRGHAFPDQALISRLGRHGAGAVLLALSATIIIKTPDQHEGSEGEYRDGTRYNRLYVVCVSTPEPFPHGLRLTFAWARAGRPSQMSIQSGGDFLALQFCNGQCRLAWCREFPPPWRQYRPSIVAAKVVSLENTATLEWIVSLEVSSPLREPETGCWRPSALSVVPAPTCSRW